MVGFVEITQRPITFFELLPHLGVELLVLCLFPVDLVLDDIELRGHGVAVPSLQMGSKGPLSHETRIVRSNSGFHFYITLF